MSDDQYVPLIDREDAPESGTRVELPDHVRERISVVTAEVTDADVETSLEYLVERAGETPILEPVLANAEADEVDPSNAHDLFVEHGATIHVLTYLETLVTAFHKREIRRKNRTVMLDTGNALEVSTETEPVEETMRLVENLRTAVSGETAWTLQRAGPGGVVEFV